MRRTSALLAHPLSPLKMVPRLFRLARALNNRLGAYLLGFTFAHMSFAIPVRRLRETDSLLAFHHPRPSYPLHILLVPKRAISSLGDLGPQDGVFLSELFLAVQSLAAEFDLEKSGYRLIANGGKYQEIPQLHFHLIAEKEKDEP